MTPSQTSNWIDPQALMRVKNLQWQAKTVVDGFMSGLHRSPLQGSSVEFSEYRPYSPGDDPKSIDWKLFARTDRHYIKKYEDETNRRCYFVLDVSASMHYGSLEYQKIEYARTLVATLGYFLLRQRDAIGLGTFSDGLDSWLPAQYQIGHFQRFLAELDISQARQTPARKRELPEEALARVVKSAADRLRRRSLVILVSDFLLPLDTFAHSLKQLSAMQNELLLIQVLDRNETDFHVSQSILIEDAESHERVFVDAATIATSYRTKFLKHQSQLQSVAAECSARLETLRTDQSPADAIPQLFHR